MAELGHRSSHIPRWQQLIGTMSYMYITLASILH